MGRRKKRRGHYCWSCGEVRPNERFSGKGHSRHLCKDCQKLGRSELELRQAERDIERLLNWDGTIRKKKRRQLDRFLEHQNRQVREYAERIVQDDAELRGLGNDGARSSRYPFGEDELLSESMLEDTDDDHEALLAFRDAFREDVRFPQDASVAGHPVSVEDVVYEGSLRRGLDAKCVTANGESHSIGLADVVFADSVEAAKNLAAYRRWLGLPASSLPTPPPAAGHTRRPEGMDIGLEASVELVVLNVKQKAARCRVASTDGIVTFRGQVSRLVPGTVITVHPRKHWSYAGHRYLSGEIEGSRVDVAALELLPLELRPEGIWDPSEEYWGEPDEPLPDWASAIIARGPRSLFEMEQILPGEDPDAPDIDPIILSNEAKDRGERDEARRILNEALESDLRCLDAHAHLGNLVFEHRPSQAIAHYEIGKVIGDLSLGETFDGVLCWGLVDNRPYLRCLHGYGLCLWRLGHTAEAAALFERMLWLNPSDNQGIRFLIDDVKSGRPWDDRHS